MRSALRRPFAALAAIAVTATALPLVAAAGETVDKPTAVIGVPGWPSAQVSAHVIGTILEDRLGFAVSYKDGSVGDLFEMLADGEIDIIPEIWLPNHRDYVRRYGETERVLEVASRGIPAQQGLCTTRHAAETYGIRSVFDLLKPEVAAALDSNADQRGEIWIGSPDWESTRIEKVRAASYGYVETMQLLEADERTAMAALDVAVAVERPYVFYCYEPHHMFELHDIVMLEEPAYDPTKWNVRPGDEADWLENSEAGSAWGLTFIHVGYNSEFGQMHPAIVTMIDNMDLEADTISEMTYAVGVERQDPDAFAATWIAENDARVSDWLGQ